MTIVQILSAAVLLLAVLRPGSGSAPSYAITLPSLLRSGVPFNVSVSLLAPHTGRVQLHFELSDLSGAKKLFSHMDHALGASSMITLTLPADVRDGRYTMKVTGSGAMSFHQSIHINVEQHNLLLLVQMDKPIYKPGQKVMFRVVALKLATMTPQEGHVTIDVVDPQANKVNRWTENATGYGVIAKEMTLSEYPMLGEWKIKVSMGDQSTEKTFTVDEYVLPKYEVKLNVPSFITERDRVIAGVVSAKYTYGKAVKGMATVRVQYKNWYGWWAAKTAPPAVATTVEVDGTGEFSIHLPETFFDHHQSPELHPRMLRVNFGPFLVECNVTESLTGRSMLSKEEIRVTKSAVEIDFLENNPKSFKPGLTYTGFVHVKRADGTRLTGRRQKLIVEARNALPRHYGDQEPSFESREERDIPDDGIVAVHVNSTQSSSRVQLRLRYGDDVGSTIHHFLSAYYSPSNSFLQLKRARLSPVVAGDRIEFRFESSEAVDRVHYQVMTDRQMLVHSDTSFAAGSIQIPTSSLMAPRSTLLAYYFTAEGELVLDAAMFDVSGDLLANKVELSADADEYRPGRNASIRVEASPDSYVGLLAVDQSVLLLKSGNDLSVNDAVTSTPAAKMGRYYFWGSTQVQDLLDRAGMVFITDGSIPSERPSFYEPIAYSAPGIGPKIAVASESDPVAAGPAPVPMRTRKLFPETWIFTNLTTDSEGKAEYNATVPDTISSWVLSAFAVSHANGLGIAHDKLKLRVFQPFFVSVNLPYSVIRGEHVALQVTVFNYFDHELTNVKVTLKRSNDFLVVRRDITSNDVVERLVPLQADVSVDIESIPPQNGRTISFPIKPKTLGQKLLRVEARCAVAADAVEKLLLIKSQGIERFLNQPVMVDLRNETSFTTTLTTELPSTVIRDSIRTKITIHGDILGPSIDNLDNLLTVPYGCGEQNMISLTPNIFIGRYLESIGQFGGVIRDKAISHMQIGYQRQLTYRHRKSGGYSAFGEADPSASSWLTAFVLRSFRQARHFIYIDEDVLSNAQTWLVAQQGSDGDFNEPGKVLQSYMQGGATSSVARTAYIVIALTEGERNSSLEVAQAIDRAAEYLETRLLFLEDAYSLAIVTYALQLAGRDESADMAFGKLEAFAKDQGAVKFWSSTDDGSTSNDVETTAYALLSYARRGMVTEALPIVRWLVSRRSALGGYASTQDTVMSLQALAEIATQAYADGIDLHIRVDAGDGVREWDITGENAFVLQSWEIPDAASTVRVRASGRGLALVQVSTAYYVPSDSRRTPLEISPRVVEESVNAITIDACAKSRSGDTGMALMEVEIPSGFAVDAIHLKDLLRGSHRHLHRTEVMGNKAILYFDKLDAKQVCVPVRMERVQVVARPARVFAHVYDYYSPETRNSARIDLPKLKAISICAICADCIGC